MTETGTIEFKECNSCRAKPGTPTLCPQCLMLRRLVQQHNDAKGDGPIRPDRQLAEVGANLNDYVWVRLTELGRKIHRQQFDAAMKGYLSLAGLEYRPPQHVAGWDRFQLWDLMALYGPHMYNGAPQVFADNMIRVQGSVD